MRLRASTRRWLAALLLGVLAFAQGSIAFAACALDRGQLGGSAQAPAHAMPAGHECCEDEDAPAPSNACVAHCTSDLQAFGWASFAVPAAARVVLFVAPRELVPAAPVALAEAPPPRVPPRILLHSFLI